MIDVSVADDTDSPSGEVGLIAGAFDEPGVDNLFDDFLINKPVE